MYNIYLWLNLPQKLSQPVAFQRFSPSLPFFEQVQTPLPLFKFLSSFTPHYISLGDDYDEERRERRRANTNPTFIPRSPVLKQLGRTTETLATLCVYFWHLVNGFEVSKFPALVVSPAATEPPCQKTQLSSTPRLEQELSKTRQMWRFFVDVSANSRTAWGELAETLISFVKYCERDYSAK